MTKKHFIAFAAEIKKELNNPNIPFDQISWSKAIAGAQFVLVCKIAKQFNPKFKEEKFRIACGL